MPCSVPEKLVLIRGAGDLASGIALRLRHAGFAVVMTEIPNPSAVRRTVAFSEAVRLGQASVEDCRALLAATSGEAAAIAARGDIAVLVDPAAEAVRTLKPAALVDAVIAKRNTGTRITDAPVVIGVGPGFTAGVDCHGVVETMRGHTLGRLINAWDDPPRALPNTGVPGDIGGQTTGRLLRAPRDGLFRPRLAIGDSAAQGQTVAIVESAAPPVPITAGCAGLVRGLLPDRYPVHTGMKCGDIDPRAEERHCRTVSDKALSIAGGVLEALLRYRA